MFSTLYYAKKCWVGFASLLREFLVINFIKDSISVQNLSSGQNLQTLSFLQFLFKNLGQS